MEWLKRAVIDGAIAIAVCFNIFPEIPSGPQLVLVASSEDSIEVTSSTVQSRLGQGPFS